MPDPTCAVDTCDRPARKRGLCTGHYRRLRVHGDVLADVPFLQRHYAPPSEYMPSDPTLTREERLTASLHARVRSGLAESDETWNGTPHLIWIRRSTSKGYGVVRDGLRGNNVGVHRVAWEMERGPIPEGLTIDHLCRVTLCANVLHLEPVPLLENVMRADPGAAKRAMTHCKRGHEFNEENTRVYKGQRFCRPCNRQWRADRRAQGLGV